MAPWEGGDDTAAPWEAVSGMGSRCMGSIDLEAENARLRADFERYKRRSNKVLRGAKKPRGNDAGAKAGILFLGIGELLLELGQLGVLRLDLLLEVA